MPIRFEGPQGKEPHKFTSGPVPEKKQSLINQRLEAIQANIQNVHKSMTAQGLPPDKIALTFNIFDQLMDLKENLALNQENIDQIEFASLTTRVDQLMMQTLSPFPFTKTEGKVLDQSMKGYIFTLLYTIGNERGRDSTSKKMLTDIIGQEVQDPLSVTLEEYLQQAGCSNEQVKEGVKYASYIYPFTLLSLYMHKDAPIPKGDLNLLALGDGRSFDREYVKHFGKVHKDDPVQWSNCKGLWSQMFPAAIEMIWRSRMEKSD